MRPFRDMPIRSKLTAVIMATCSMALLVSYIALTARHAGREPGRLLDRVTVLARVIGANTTAAVAFNDRASAEQTLAALDAEPSIIAAYIFDRDGSLLASFSEQEHEAPRLETTDKLSDAAGDGQEEPGNLLWSERLRVSSPIILDGETIGTVLVYADLRQFRLGLLWDVGVISLIIIAVGVLALVFSYQLQKVISEPILRLAATMKHISNVKDYSHTVKKSSNDELGTLIEGFNEMLEQIRARDERLEHHREQLEEAQRIAHLGHWEWDVCNDRFCLSSRASSVLGLSAEGLDTGLETIMRSVHPEDRHWVREVYDAAKNEGGVLDVEHRVMGKNGDVRFVHQRGESRRDPVTHALYFAGTVQNVTERVRAEEKLRIAANALENTGDSVIIMDSNRRIVSVNRAFTTMTQFSREEVFAQSPAVLRSDRHDAAFYSQIWEQVDSTGRWQGELWGRRRNGEVYPQRISISEIRSAAGKASHYLSVSSDISRYKEYEARLEFFAHHDALTRLSNRVMFQMQLQEALLRARRRGSLLGLMFIDLDRFKTVNDSLGHATGDQLLYAVATRIKECLRGSDVAARQGGDEFTVLLEGLTDQHDVAKVAQKLLDEVSKPFMIAGHELFISASIGISCYPQDAPDADLLLKNADAAMYRAKQRGRNGYEFYSAEMNTQALEALVMSNSLRAALERDEFAVHYQPRVDLASGAITAIEALVRWQHPERGMIPPSTFIPLAEDMGLIEAIGERVLATACRQVKAWQEAGLPPVAVAVNISARQFRHDGFAERVATILRETGLEARFLEIEITESMMMQDHKTTERVLAELSAMDITIAVDDFGTGYSSLAYLKRFPIDRLKIDQSFVRDVPGDLDDVAITKAIITLAKSLKVTAVAEGVETMAQHAFLEKCGCDEAQGYLFSRPLAAIDMETLLRSQPNLRIPTAA